MDGWIEWVINKGDEMSAMSGRDREQFQDLIEGLLQTMLDTTSSLAWYYENDACEGLWVQRDFADAVEAMMKVRNAVYEAGRE